jgi:hypothetical protein
MLTVHSRYKWSHRERRRNSARVVEGAEVARHRRRELHAWANLKAQATASPRPAARLIERALRVGRHGYLWQVESDRQLPVYRIDGGHVCRESGAEHEEAIGSKS